MVSRPALIRATVVAVAMGLAVAPIAAAQGSVALTVLPSTTQVQSGQSLRVALTIRSTGSTSMTGISTCLMPPVQLSITRATGATRTGRRACFTVAEMAPDTRATRTVELRAVSDLPIDVHVVARGSATCPCAPIPMTWSPVVRITPGTQRTRVAG